MSMSTHVVGFKPPDAKWKKMKEVYTACINAGLAPPDEVMEFFNHSEPDEKGVEISEEELERVDCLQEWTGDGQDGFEIRIDKLPKDIKIIRFYNSY